jgi:hypothetical protein
VTSGRGGEQVPQPEGAPAGVGEIVRALWVKIDHDLIGALQAVDPAEEHVELNARLVGQVHQGGRLVADDVAERTALLLHLNAGDPLGVLGRV